MKKLMLFFFVLSMVITIEPSQAAPVLSSKVAAVVQLPPPPPPHPRAPRIHIRTRRHRVYHRRVVRHRSGIHIKLPPHPAPGHLPPHP